MPRKPDRCERLASNHPMREPVADPDQLRELGPRALVGALQGGARYSDALLDASEDAWNECPTFYVGDEGRIAKIHLSRDGYRMYEAMGRSNMLELSIEHPREFLKEVPSEEANRFIEMVIDQLTAWGVMEPSALYEAPFSSVHVGGPETLFAGKSNVIKGIFEKRQALHPEPLADAG